MDIKGIHNVREHKAVRKWDIVALFVFLALIVALFVVMFMPQGSYVEVYEAGNLVYKMSLDELGTYNIDDKLTMVIDEKGVCVKDAICPDKLCEMQGHIHTNGASIVCLPSKITIVIKSDKDKVDVVS